MKKIFIAGLLFVNFHTHTSEFVNWLKQKFSGQASIINPTLTLKLDIEPIQKPEALNFTKIDFSNKTAKSFNTLKDAFEKKVSYPDLKKLVDDGIVIVNSQGYDGQTPLHYFLKTLEEQNVMIEDLMLSPNEAYLVPNEDNSGYTQKSLAEVNNIITLLATPENLSTRDNAGYTPIMLARNIGIENTTDTFRALQNTATHAALSNAIQRDNVQQIIQLINSGASIWNCIEQCDHLFELAQNNKELENTIFFDISHTNNLHAIQLQFLLNFACKNKLTRIATYVINQLNQNAINETLDQYGNTFLMEATTREASDIVRLLIAKGALVDQTDNNNETALHKAAALHNSPDTAEILIQNGANVNAISSNLNQTPLHIAALNNRTAIITLLLENQANINAQDRNQETPFDYALQADSYQAAGLLNDRNRRQ